MLPVLRSKSAVSYNALDPSRVTISFANALEANKTYTILFGENVKDVAGNSAANVVAFTTAGEGVTPPDPDVPSYEVAFAAIGAGTIGYTGPDGSAELGAGSTKTLAQGKRRYGSGKPDRKREIYVLGSYGYGPHCKRTGGMQLCCRQRDTADGGVRQYGGPDACGV